MATITMYNSINVDDAFSPTFVAVATGGTTAASTTDTFATWTARTLPSTAAWNSLAYGNAMIVTVAGGPSTKAASSPDGVTWTARTLPVSVDWKSVAFGNGTFVAVANGSTSTAVSVDGVTWTSGGNLPSAAAWSCACYGNGVFVVVSSGSSSVAAYSTNNGANWQSCSGLPTADWRSVTYGNSKFVAVSYGSDVAATSSNGATWTQQVMSVSSNWSSVTYGAGLFVAVAYNTNIAATSPNGTEWSSRTLSATANWNCVSYGITSTQGLGAFTVTATGTTATSASYDGVTWIAKTIASATWTYHIFAPVTWNSGDTLVVNNGAVITVNTNQKKFWKTITGNYGELRITNSSDTSSVNFYMGRVTAATVNAYTPASGLFDTVISGAFITLGTGTGQASQSFSNLPYTEYVPSLWVETGQDTGVYEIWNNITGEFGPYMKLFGRSGLECVSNGKRGNYFVQGTNPAPCTIFSLTNGVTTIQSRRVTCTSTAGILPGAQITGTNIPASTVVHYVIDSTTLELNAVCTASGSSITFTCYNPIQSQYTSTVTFGNGTHGNVIPSGARVKVPNIMISDATPVNLVGASNQLDGSIALTNAASIDARTCLFGNIYLNATAASSVYFRNVSFAYQFLLSKCYQVDIDGLGTAASPTYWYYGTRWVIRDQRYGTVAPGGYTAATNSMNAAISYIDNAKVKNWHKVVYSAAYLSGTALVHPVDLSYSSNMAWENIRIVSIDNRRIVYNLNISNRVYDSTFKNLELYGACPLYVSTSDRNSFNGIEYSLGMFNYVYGFITGHRIYQDPANSLLPLTANTKYYFKTRTFFSGLNRDDFYESNEYSTTPFQGGWQFPDYLSIRPTESVANSVTLEWGRRAPEPGTILYEIYKDTTEGFTARNAANRIYSSATAATVSYIDTAVTAGTRYFYRFRKYNFLTAKTGCSAGNGSTTLTNSGSFNTFYTLAYCFFGQGSTTVRTIASNFYNSMFYPGSTITGTGIDDGTTVVSIDLNGTEMVISKPTLSAQSNVTLGLPIQVGMAVNHANIPAGTTVLSIESSTSLTLSNATTGLISSASVNFFTFTESPEFTCIPNYYKMTGNYLIQSRGLSTASWTSSNITPTADQYQAPTDAAWGTLTADTLTATNANGTTTQTVTGLSVGETYTASIWVRADQTAALPNGVDGSLQFGTTVTNFTATNDWKKYTATLQATGSSHNFVVKVNTNTQAIQAVDAMVNIGSTAKTHINVAALITVTAAAGRTLTFNVAKTITGSSGSFITDGFTVGANIVVTGTSLNNGTYTIVAVTATVITVAEALVTEAAYSGTATLTRTTLPGYMPLLQLYSRCRSFQFTGSNEHQGITIMFGTAPPGSYYHEIYMSTTPGFTPSDANIIASTYTIDSAHLQLTGSSNNTISNVTKMLGGGACAAAISPLYLTTNSGYNIVKNVNMDLDYCHSSSVPPISFLVGCNFNVFHNIDFGHVKNNEAGSGILNAVSVNTASRCVVQNIKTVHYDMYLGFLSLNSTARAMPSARTCPATTATTYGLGDGSTGIATAYTACFGTMFYQLHQSASTGLLSIVFEDTVGDTKPYTILAGSPKFSNVGQLYLQTPGDSIEFVWPYKIKGISSFRDIMPIINAVDLGSSTTKPNGVKAEYTIMTGSTYGDYKRLTTANLTGETVNTTSGFYLKIKLTAVPFMKFSGMTNPFVADETIRGVSSLATAVVSEAYLYSASTGTVTFSSTSGTFIAGETIVRHSDGQARSTNVATNGFALGPSYTSVVNGLQVFTNVDQSVVYPIATPTLTLTGLKPNSEVRVYDSNGNEVAGIETVGSSTTWSTTYDYYGTDIGVSIVVVNLAYQVLRLENVTLGITGLSVPVQQQIDRQYNNAP